MFPKPQPRPKKKPKQWRRSRWGVQRRVAGPRPSDDLPFPKPRREEKTKHGRRPRETGRMLFYKTLECDAAGALAQLLNIPVQRAREIVGPCDGLVEAAHLGKRKGYRAPDDQTAPLCTCHHRCPGIDGNIGGRATFYVALSLPDRDRCRRLLYLRAAVSWNHLTDAQRAGWVDRAAERMLAA